jgi:hypothetical protein
VVPRIGEKPSSRVRVELPHRSRTSSTLGLRVGPLIESHAARSFMVEPLRVGSRLGESLAGMLAFSYVMFKPKAHDLSGRDSK